VQRVALGRTGVSVPAVSVGTWGHSGPRRIRRHPVGWSGQDDVAARRSLIRAWELELTHWDTADAYGAGHAETLIGSLWEEVPRSSIFLATKVGWEKGSAGHGYDPAQMRRQIEGSLERLATETIDLLYLHHCDFGPDDRYLEPAVELLREFQAEGRIRWIGLSDWDCHRVATYTPRVDPDVVQVYRSVLADTYHSSGLGALVTARDLGVCFFSPLQHGLLLGRYDEPPRFERGDHRSRRKEFQDADLLQHLRECRRATQARFSDRRHPVLEALLGTVLEDAPGCVLVGMRRPEHAEAAASVDVPLSTEDAAWVRRTYRQFS